jgi:hypothetical protein
VAAQGLTGTLIGTVKDEQGGVLAGARVRLSSPALIGGPRTLPTNENGQLRFPSLAPGTYILEVEFNGFAGWRDEDVRIGAGATVERRVLLKPAFAESVTVEGAGSRIDARDPGFGTRSGPEDLKAMPTRRSGMFDFIRAAPGISPTSPSSGTISTISAFGSGTNENMFLIDGTNFTCPCNGVARAEPGIDFIQEIHVQSAGASAEFGNVQGAVINVITRQGSDRFLYDAAYYAQTAALTSQPVVLPMAPGGSRQSGYERARYRDVNTNLGGPVVRGRLWFFTGYQHAREADSQPGTDPSFPRTSDQDRIFAKLTWRLAPAWQLMQSLHDEFWVEPQQPTLVTPFDATVRSHASVPSMTFGHLTHSMSANTVWDVRVGRFAYSRQDEASSGSVTAVNRFDRVTRVTSGGPQDLGRLLIARTTAKATVTHYRPRLLRADHEWKMGGQVERGSHHSPRFIPTGVRFVDDNGAPFQAVSRDPWDGGGVSVTASAFVSDALTVGDRVTINAGLRFDHSRAISQDLPRIDQEGRETGDIVAGLGTLFTWNVFSPRLGLTAKLTTDGRTLLRTSYGRFRQGVLTGELSPVHPGQTRITTAAFDAATGGYTRIISVVDPTLNVGLDPGIRAPRTDEYSIGVDRELGRGTTVAMAFVHKSGGHFIGWTDAGGQYREIMRPLADGRNIPVLALVTPTFTRRFVVTNPDAYSLTYDGLVVIAEKRRSRGWQAFGSYTLSRAHGLQPSSGATAAGPQVSTISPPNPSTFGRDPNDLTNAMGRLPNDRPHIFRLMGSVDLGRTGVVVAGTLQTFSGKPWAATAQVLLPQGDQRILLEPRGSRRLSSQSLLDLRVSRLFRLGAGRIELLVDVLNVFNDAAEEGLATDNLFSPAFGQPTTFVDPRRAMVGVRLNVGR